METPICDFVKEYADNGFSRFHMPGHKGRKFIGCEKYDITEIDGADVLSHAEGIIKKSQENAAKLFGSGASLFNRRLLTVHKNYACRCFCRLQKKVFV